MSYLIRINHGLNEQFAHLVINPGKDEKLCCITSVCDGAIRGLPAGAAKFCREWLGPLPKVRGEKAQKVG